MGPSGLTNRTWKTLFSHDRHQNEGDHVGALLWPPADQVSFDQFQAFARPKARGFQGRALGAGPAFAWRSNSSKGKLSTRPLTHSIPI